MATLSHSLGSEPHHVGTVAADPALYNEDLAPVPMDRRTWTGYSIFAMWMSDVHSVGGYTFAASLFLLGLTGWQVLLAMTAGILVVYVLMNMIGRPSLREGIPFPVMARVSMGVMGANLAAIIRGVVGIVWYGVQTYFASKAVATIILLFVPSAAALASGPGFMGLDTLGWISFLVMWVGQLLIFQRGMETIRRFIDFCGPAVYVVMFALMAWILYHAGLGSLNLTLGDVKLSGMATLGQMVNAMLLVVAYFAALLLNFGDFSRFGKSERQMKVGNFLGLPVNFLVFSIIVVIVTAGSVAVFGEMLMDPVEIVSRIDNKVAVFIGSVTFIIATMGINIVANFVSPAYDIANLFPRHVDFKRGGLITSILAVLVCPWIFVELAARHHRLRVGVRGHPCAALRRDGRGLLPGEAREGRDARTLHPRSERALSLRRRLEPRRPEGARALRRHRHRLGALDAALPHPAREQPRLGDRRRVRCHRLHGDDARRPPHLSPPSAGRRPSPGPLIPRGAVRAAEAPCRNS
ncbi:MAG: NCS1 family nucleobase:cation symporter-1 [Amaricoccus sp.]